MMIFTPGENWSIKEKINLLLSDILQHVKFVGEHEQQQPAESNKVDGLEGHEEVSFVK